MKKTTSIIITVLITVIITGLSVFGVEEIRFKNAKPEQKAETPLNITELRMEPLAINDEFKGFVRVIIFENGFEHVTTPVLIQWLDENQSKILKEMTFNQEGPWSLGINSIDKTSDGLLLKLNATNSYTDELQNGTYEIKIGDETASGNL